MDDKRAMLKHFLAALAYRTQKALRDAPPEFASFQAGSQIRTPQEIISHMDSVIGYARTFLIGGQYRVPKFDNFSETVKHFHEILEDMARHIEKGTEFKEITAEILLQGPFSDAMTHAGQLAMLRRQAGCPVPPENFIFAEINSDNLSSDQPLPARPDKIWPEAPVHEK